jgi:hypothetical protein
VEHDGGEWEGMPLNSTSAKEMDRPGEWAHWKCVFKCVGGGV